MGETQTFLPEQVMGMLITKLKETAEAGMKTKVVDVVISVSISYFGTPEPCKSVSVKKNSWQNHKHNADPDQTSL